MARRALAVAYKFHLIARIQVRYRRIEIEVVTGGREDKQLRLQYISKSNK